VGCKWVYKTKSDSKGNIKRFKAQLMDKCFMPRGGIDFRETFSAVSCKDSFRINNGISGALQLGITLDGCKDDIPQRGSVREYIHGTTQRFCCERKRTHVMPSKKNYLWIKASL
jgi:hypothetical protein